MAQKKKFPDSWEEFQTMYNKLDCEDREKFDSILYDFLVMKGKIEPDPEVEALKNRLKEELRLAEEAEQRAEELRKEIEKLRVKNSRNAGRKANDEKFKESFNKFADLYKSNTPANEIMKETGISKRTYYRYKKLYQEKGGQNKNGNGKEYNNQQYK